MKKIFLFFSFIVFSSALFSQGKKDIKTYKIKATSENVTATEGGKDISFRDSYTAFDKNGNTLEDIQYNKDGTVKKKITTKYDSNKNKTEEVEYDGTGVIKKHLYSYNSKGDKTLEVTYDGSGKLIKKEVYLYNNKGLKVEKKIYDANNTLLETHKFTYEM